MPTIELEMRIEAPIERVFDLARSIDLHRVTQSRHREEAIAGVTTGLIGLGEEVTWRATHFGLRLRLTSRIEAFDRPWHFRDSMVRGPFARFDHDHHFRADGASVVMRDVFDYRSPLGWLGRLADGLAVERHMTRLLEERAAILRRVAESDQWTAFLTAAGDEPLRSGAHPPGGDRSRRP